MAKIVGIGGVFHKTKDPDGLRAWYERVLGLEMTDWGSAMFADLSIGFQQWSVFPDDTDYLKPSDQEFMVNFIVDDLDGLVAHIEGENVEILDRQSEEYGKFAWIIDPAGVKLELWQPPEG